VANLSKDHKIILHAFVVGPLGMNCYVLVDAATKETCIIDPGGDPNTIKNFLQKNGFELKFIINTHGHGDHIRIEAEIPERTRLCLKNCIFSAEDETKGSPSTG
jgi:glyoxylase-like metal-dependent hydrolase (beta-lactamase superfamily II)